MSALSFDIQIRCTKKSSFPIQLLKAATCKILKELGWKKASLSIWLVGDKRIRRLNRQYLKHDRATDVIAFSQLEGKKLKVSTDEIFLGDLVISLDTTARQAAEYGNPFFYELAFYLCHGILHLMGYSDETKKQARWMDRKQRVILEKIGIGHLIF